MKKFIAALILVICLQSAALAQGVRLSREAFLSLDPPKTKTPLITIPPVPPKAEPEMAKFELRYETRIVRGRAVRTEVMVPLNDAARALQQQMAAPATQQQSFGVPMTQVIQNQNC